MLNVFPEFLFLGLLAPFLIRVAVGILFFLIGYSYLFKMRNSMFEQTKTVGKPFVLFLVWFGGIFEMLIGLFLIAGFLTQIVAIAGALIALNALIGKWKYINLNGIAKYSKTFYFLVFIVCLSLLFSGAGAFAIDLPL